ncbi:MAG: CmcJ/NvfI family oxidoreductase, partial [Thalassobaculaceae bacterium]
MPQTHPQAGSGQELRAPLTFIRRQATKPQFKSAALTGGEPEVTFDLERHEVDIHDMRQVADRLTLDNTGFELRRAPTGVADLYDDAAITAAYEPEVIALLKGHTGADEVVIFDHTRRSDAATGASNPDGARGPASRVHVDYTVASGPQR